MSKIIYEVGQRVQVAAGQGQYSGKIGVVIGGLTLRFGFGDDGNTGKQAYRVEWEDGSINPAQPHALQPAPPLRKDMDDKVAWCWFSPEVERAIKEGVQK